MNFEVSLIIMTLSLLSILLLSMQIFNNQGYRTKGIKQELALDDIRRFAKAYFSEDDSVKALQDVAELLLTNLAAAITVIDSKSGSLFFCSPYTEALTGYTLDEIEQLNTAFLPTIIIEDDFPRFKRALEVCDLGEDISVRYRIRHQRGLILWVESHLVPIVIDNGNTKAVMAVSNDVTSSVRYQERVEEQNRDLNDFSYMISHDLKAPIFSIKGMTQILQEELAPSLSENAKECLTHVAEGAKRLEKLVESVTEYSALTTSQSEETDVKLEPVIKNVLADLKTQILAANATINIAEDLPDVRGSEIRLYQVFSNLISNALKFRSHDRECKITVELKRANADSICLAVSDNGSGIPADRLQSVFRPFQRAHGKDIEGSGIGLASVKKIVERFGGKIEVTSVERQGSTFLVTLMRSKSDITSIPPELSRWYS